MEICKIILMVFTGISKIFKRKRRSWTVDNINKQLIIIIIIAVNL